jgi:hypothetical protein
MATLPLKPMIYAAAAVLFLAVVYAPDPNARTFSTLSTGELIEALSSSRETIRRAASGQLIARAKTVVPQLVEALPAADEAQLRGLFVILEELMLSNDAEVAESAESALERLTGDRDKRVADQAIEVLIFNSTLRHGRALLTFTELGGRLDESRWNRSGPVEAATTTVRTPMPLVVVIDSQWRGGDQGLLYLARMFPGEMIAVHITTDAPVTEAGVASLSASRNQLVVRREHDSCLGIILDTRSFSTVVNVAGVIHGSPAERGGLRTGDALIDIDGVPILQVEDVGRYLSSLSPGDFVRITLRRGSQTVRLRLALGSDFLTGRCHCNE